ncbi:YopX family protein [Campylobacter sp. JMF_03 NE3]|uniref:YopX family protein n=2 Tax=unclassified Campylobacter TaxID=2593542 RepID=UPI0022E9AD37|nr:YopX family protein [Campylobacter sp. JMF_03 NE3]MDA3053342.1 YopX family protein [Campylobacter sp. JMF_03 NE3]
MKKLKYRAWAIIDECYLDMESGYFYLAPDGTFYEITKLRNGETDYNEVSADVQFYTGLKDKKGKEIYEKDIIKFMGNLFVVSYNENEAHYALQTMRCGELKNDSILTSFIASVGEVVGNVYQNGDLLK